MMLTSVVLPAPFGPMIDMISPRRTESVTSPSARTPPKRLDTPATATWVSPGPTADACAGLKTMPTPPPMQAAYVRHDGNADAGMQEPLSGTGAPQHPSATGNLFPAQQRHTPSRMRPRPVTQACTSGCAAPLGGSFLRRASRRKG